jgi:hypothetical protein
LITAYEGKEQSRAKVITGLKQVMTFTDGKEADKVLLVQHLSGAEDFDCRFLPLSKKAVRRLQYFSLENSFRIQKRPSMTL